MLSGWTRLGTVGALALGGGVWAGAMCLPGAFVGLQLLTFPSIVLGGLGESYLGLPATWRPIVHESLTLGLLIYLGSGLFPRLVIEGMLVYCS
ncbi:MAG: hypothetical protein GKR86_12085, partial [Ilumatobacter sp.]|nr:hypothetical protein [Ilumatobacter sp.]